MKILKLSFFVLSTVFLLMSAPSNAQDWLTDSDEAMAQAINQEKNVLLFFTGSDWCPPCKRIKSAIFNSEEFIDYANQNLVLVMADFPKRKENLLPPEQKKKNQALAQKYKVGGFPTTIMLDREGEVIDKWVGFAPGSPEDYVEKFSVAIEKSIAAKTPPPLPVDDERRELDREPRG